MAIELMKIQDYIGLGRKICEWAKDEASRPDSVDALKQQLAGIATLPDKPFATYTRLRIVQGDSETLVLRLPQKDAVAETEQQMMGAPPGTVYPLPGFYRLTTLSPLDMFYARVGDYSIAQCK